MAVGMVEETRLPSFGLENVGWQRIGAGTPLLLENKAPGPFMTNKSLVSLGGTWRQGVTWVWLPLSAVAAIVLNARNETSALLIFLAIASGGAVSWFLRWREQRKLYATFRPDGVDVIEDGQVISFPGRDWTFEFQVGFPFRSLRIAPEDPLLICRSRSSAEEYFYSLDVPSWLKCFVIRRRVKGINSSFNSP